MLSKNCWIEWSTICFSVMLAWTEMSPLHMCSQKWWYLMLRCFVLGCIFGTLANLGLLHYLQITGSVPLPWWCLHWCPSFLLLSWYLWWVSLPAMLTRGLYTWPLSNLGQSPFGVLRPKRVGIWHIGSYSHSWTWQLLHQYLHSLLPTLLHVEHLPSIQMKCLQVKGSDAVEDHAGASSTIETGRLWSLWKGALMWPNPLHSGWNIFAGKCNDLQCCIHGSYTMSRYNHNKLT